MKKSKSLILFHQKTIRRHWDDGKELWYFSVVDVVQALTDQPEFQSARKYWNKLKERLKAEGSESVTNCHQLKMPAADGKLYLTDAADTETLLRLIQSIPSPKAAERYRFCQGQVLPRRSNVIQKRCVPK